MKGGRLCIHGCLCVCLFVVISIGASASVSSIIVVRCHSQDTLMWDQVQQQANLRTLTSQERDWACGGITTYNVRDHKQYTTQVIHTYKLVLCGVNGTRRCLYMTYACVCVYAVIHCDYQCQYMYYRYTYYTIIQYIILWYTIL